MDLGIECMKRTLEEKAVTEEARHKLKDGGQVRLLS
jgi:hypothetical protein